MGRTRRSTPRAVSIATDPSEIAEFLDYYRDAMFDVDTDGKADALFDVDANGRADALTDGVVILRYLSGFRGDSLVDGAVDPRANRTDPYEVTAYLDRFFGPTSQQSPKHPLRPKPTRPKRPCQATPRETTSSSTWGVVPMRRMRKQTIPLTSTCPSSSTTTHRRLGVLGD
jgi:hypothetical protein